MESKYLEQGLEGSIEIDPNAQETISEPLQKYIPEGLEFLIDGYVDYAKDIVVNRAIVAIDGFKPSQRRILYTFKYIEGLKEGELTKSANIAGTTMKLHPHGDASIYDTMVRMTDSSEVMNVPYLKGKGTFGKIYSNGPAAAARYTECGLLPITEELFRDMQGTITVPSYDNKLQEPVLLPTTFPNILYNTTQGIAVGVASNIPSFNFHEVNEATIEYLEQGTFSKVLVPDFSTGGYYVENKAELEKLMSNGRARLKLRGKWHIEGKTIVITEIPYYTTTDEIMRHIRVKELRNITEVRDESDRSGLKLCVECVNKASVDEVLTDLLRETNLQMQITTNVVVIVDNSPKVIGIREVIHHWVEFRKTVLERALKIDLSNVITKIERAKLLVDLLSDKFKRDKMIDNLMVSKAKAIEYLENLYPDYDSSLDWVIKLSLESLSEVESKKRQLERLLEEEKTLRFDLENINLTIARQLRELNTKYKFPRKTEVTDKDYVFEKGTEKVKAMPVPTLVMRDGKFIKKLHATTTTTELSGIRCLSNDVISIADNKGRLLRVHLDNLEFHNVNERGTYIPVFLGLEDDFDIVFWDVIADKKVGYIYKDGYASIIDYAEWLDAKRCTKVTPHGTNEYITSIVAEIDFSKPYILVITEKGEFGFLSTEFLHKSRKARTKLATIKHDDAIVTTLGVTEEEYLALVTNHDKYTNKVNRLRHGDIFNDELFQELMSKK
jgi:DNA gyrase subunit A